MQSRLERVAKRHAADPDGASVLAAGAQEIELYERIHACYGCGFYIARKPAAEPAAELL